MKIREEEVSKKPKKFSFFVEEIKEDIGKKDLEYYLRNDRKYTQAEKEEYKRLKAEKEKEILENDEWQRGDWEYEWYSNGELKNVKLPDGQKVRFEYDALGRRTKKIFNNKIIRYLWDGNVLLHEWEYDIENEPKKVINELGEIGYDKKEPIENLITWVYENNSFVPCAKIVDNEYYSIINDYIGRPIQAYDDVGNLVWSAEYDIYGNLRNLQGDRNFVPFRQLGQYEDEETGLYYNRFRYYDCNTGTYISKDPIGLVGGLNVYAYVWDSNTQVDILGLDVYKLIVKQDGWYPVFERGKTQPTHYTKLKKGDVYKIGESKNFKKRYSEASLNSGVINKSKAGAFTNIDGDIVPVGVEPIFVSQGKTKIEDQALEKKLLQEYIDNNGKLPAGNKICK